MAGMKPYSEDLRRKKIVAAVEVKSRSFCNFLQARSSLYCAMSIAPSTPRSS